MAQVSISINGKSYLLGCEDGGEAQLRALAGLVDERVRRVAADAAPLGETRLILIAALMLAEEVSDAKVQVARLQTAHDSLETQAEEALNAAAARIEAMSPG